MTPFEVYTCYLSLKNHFTKENYDYFKFNGKTRASITAFNKRKDRYFFERTSRKKTDEEVKAYFLANFVECDDPQGLWIGNIIQEGEDLYQNWLKKSQSLTYVFKEEIEKFFTKENFTTLFEVNTTGHPDVLKLHLSKEISLETMVILDLILEYVKNFDKKLQDPIWEFYSKRIRKYKPFINIDVSKCRTILRNQVL